MGDDDFKPLDINALHRRAQTSAAREQGKRQSARPTVMEQQRRRELRPQDSMVPADCIVEGREDGRPCWILQGQPVREGQILEVYTNRANGFVRGQVSLRPWPERPQLTITVWDAWGTRDADGLPPRVGTWSLELLDGIKCRYTGALPQEID